MTFLSKYYQNTRIKGIEHVDTNENSPASTGIRGQSQYIEQEKRLLPEDEMEEIKGQLIDEMEVE